jgi:hypothetical protein
VILSLKFGVEHEMSNHVDAENQRKPTQNGEVKFEMSRKHLNLGLPEALIRQVIICCRTRQIHRLRLSGTLCAEGHMPVEMQQRLGFLNGERSV